MIAEETGLGLFLLSQHLHGETEKKTEHLSLEEHFVVLLL
jgi:hypothetical protein